MIVREDISFERGKEPKGVMDIGGKRFFKDQVLKMFMWDEENGNSGMIHNLDTNMDGDAVIIAFDRKFQKIYEREAVKYLRMLFKKFSLDHYINLYPTLENHGVGVVQFAFHMSRDGEDLGLKARRLWLQFGNELVDSEHIARDYEYGHWSEIVVDEPLPPIEESYNFERGKDPKASMDIGIAQRAKEVLANSHSDASSLFINNPFHPMALSTLVQHGDPELVKWWIRESGKKPSGFDFHYAHDIPMMKVLLDAGVPKIHIRDSIEKAAERGDIEVVKFLLDAGIKPKKYALANPLIKDNQIKDLIWKYGKGKIEPAVWESVKFERGRDPRTSMKIGVIRQIQRAQKEAEEVYGIEYVYYHEHDHELIVGYIDEEIRERVNRVMDEFFGKFITDQKPYNTGPLERAYPVNPKYYSSFEEAFDQYGDIVESVNFERGRDPRTSMGIGERGNALDIRIALDEGGTFYPAKRKTARKILKRLSEDPKAYDAYESHVQVWIMDGKKTINRIPVKEIAGKSVTFLDHLYMLKPLPKNESISFERGKDPKETMEIDLYNKLPRIVSGDYYWEGDQMRMGPDDIDKVLKNAFDPAQWERDIGFDVKFPDGEMRYMFLQDIVNNPDMDYIASHGEIYDVAMKVYEAHFVRGRDPRKVMGIGNAFENLKKGSIIQLIKDDGLEVDNADLGDFLKLVDARNFDDGSRGIDYVLINDRGQEMNDGEIQTWFMSPDFFYEYFDVIKL